jgi:hypothetical protein
MYGTDLADGDPGESDETGAYPPPVVSVRLGEIRAFRVIDDEDEPILVISDGETSVEFACGLSGVSGSAALGAQRLAEAVRDYASTIVAICPDRTVHLGRSGGS